MWEPDQSWEQVREGVKEQATCGMHNCTHSSLAGGLLLPVVSPSDSWGAKMSISKTVLFAAYSSSYALVSGFRCLLGMDNIKMLFYAVLLYKKLALELGYGSSSTAKHVCLKVSSQISVLC